VLNEAQKHYFITKKELLAALHFVKHFQQYLVEWCFLLWSDHVSLVWLLSIKNPEGILARGLITLGSYMPFNCIDHRAGCLHDNADALSQVPINPNRNIKPCPGT